MSGGTTPGAGEATSRLPLSLFFFFFFFLRCRSLRRAPRLFFNDDLDRFEPFALLIIIAGADTDQLFPSWARVSLLRLAGAAGSPNTHSASSVVGGAANATSAALRAWGDHGRTDIPRAE